MNRPELLLPAGNAESFHAAVEAGADAIYLGLSRFNARGRASNFSKGQLVTLLKEAKKNKIRIYITLNTVIKNTELRELLEYLHFLENVSVDGIIIQDWGVFYLVKSFFPKLRIHASTQLGIHNSAGTRYSAEKGFKRVVLARELTAHELEKIVNDAGIETEVFVHGALCYSFSGMCLFSSYVGGRGANRGFCAQPCRRNYQTGAKEKYLFNLKDNQLISYIPFFKRLGVASLKIEGRLKSGEYTYRVGKAYRSVLDDSNNLEEAKKELEFDLGRQKTSYFAGSDLNNAISEEAGTGICIGKVEKVFSGQILISSNIELEAGQRLRFNDSADRDPVFLTVNRVVKKDGFYQISAGKITIAKDSIVFLVKLQDKKFHASVGDAKESLPAPFSDLAKKSILTSLQTENKVQKEEFYFRISTKEWLGRINFDELDGLFLSFSKSVWNRFDFDDGLIQNNREKIFIELPKFIQENSIKYYQELVTKAFKSGIRNFVISHLSQKLLMPENCRIIAGENIYVFNDAAFRYLQTEGIEIVVYPQEIDFETLESMSAKTGIVPVFFYPELFYSRMPISLEAGENFSDDEGKTKYRRFRRNGITSIVPERPVSILHYKNRLSQNGFRRYLIDVSYDTFSKHRLKNLKSRLVKSEQLQPSTTFNFTKGLQ